MVLVISCAGTQPHAISPTYTLASVSQAGKKKYPALFCNPPQQAVIGISFVRQGYKATDYMPAHNRALRQLSWSKRVRIQGEQLFEQMARGLAARGEKIELLEVPPVALDACRADTLMVDGRAWVSVRQRAEDGHSWGGWGYFKPDPPAWIKTLPQDAGWHYATGTVKAPFKDEAGSWELAMYNALINLATVVGTKVRLLDKSFDQMVQGVRAHEVDTRLVGFRVAARWRDDKHLYVLVRAHLRGSISLLTKTAE